MDQKFPAFVGDLLKVALPFIREGVPHQATIRTIFGPDEAETDQDMENVCVIVSGAELGQRRTVQPNDALFILVGRFDKCPHEAVARGSGNCHLESLLYSVGRKELETMNREQTTLRLPAELLERLRLQAQKMGISLNALIILCLESGLGEFEAGRS